MAGLINLRALQGLRKSVSLLTQKPTLYRSIGMSSKKNDTQVAETSSSECQPVKKNWVSWGFDKEDERIDRHAVHQTMFITITLCLVFGAYYCAFMPNPHMSDWAQREGYLELRRREELGLPPIDKDYFDPETIILPTDEELGDTEIII